MVTDHCSSLYSLSHTPSPPYLPISPSPPTSVLINCCLHLLSLQNGLTALEVARASTDRDWDEEDRCKMYKAVHDYDGVVDLLSGYTTEPAVLPSHPVSGTITTSSRFFSRGVEGGGHFAPPPPLKMVLPP